jgi:hypothetical protein
MAKNEPDQDITKGATESEVTRLPEIMACRAS